MSLRGVWDAMLGRSKIGDEESDRKFYERLAAFKNVVDSNTEILKAEHRAINDKLDEQAEQLNRIFLDLSKANEDADTK